MRHNSAKAEISILKFGTGSPGIPAFAGRYFVTDYCRGISTGFSFFHRAG